MSFRYLFLCLTIPLFCACTSSEDKVERYKSKHTVGVAEHPGMQLFKTHCSHCHSSTAGEKFGRVAPPMIEIKAIYLRTYSEKEAFINAIVNFTAQPNQRKALLKDAVSQFGLMPYQKYQEESVHKIADYIYSHSIEAPDWFPAYWKAKGYPEFFQDGALSSVATQEHDYASIGLAYVNATKELLGKSLMTAMQQQGPEHALVFCNEKAIPLTDSMSKQYKAEIKRVSDKSRNPNNAATAEEVVILKQFQLEIDAGIESQPVLKEKMGRVHFYYPIITNTMCLKCHGNEMDMSPAVVQRIIQLYPMDKATGYAENQVRGIWSITFNR
jgi:mono/diheme cytochrome c family protein